MQAQSREHHHRRVAAEKARTDAFNEAEACKHSLLLNLTEVLFHRIYSFIPEFVAPHTAVCKAFKRELMKMQFVHLRIRSCPNTDLQARAMRKFGGDVQVSIYDPQGRAKLAKDVVDALCVHRRWKPWHNLTGLDASSTRMPVESLARLTQDLGPCTALHTLNLNGNLMGEEGMRGIVDKLSRLLRLTSLSLASNDLKSAGLAVLSDRLAPARLLNLRSLDLSDNKLSSAGMRQLGNALKAANASSLTHLDLSRNSFEGLCVEQLAEGLSNCSLLTSLSLSSNKSYGAPGARFLGPVLKKNTALLTLDLSCTDLYPEGMAALTEPLRSCVSLTSLNLAENKIGPKGSDCLGALLANASCLDHLDLSLNELGKVGGKNVAALLSSLTHLGRLSLKHNNIPQNVRKEIQKACAEGNHRLKNKIGASTFFNMPW
eukprot:Tamp_06389.p1 GENE.Tamp_06389~~Tamp_06389.p1  ORF type:complete len:485 (-),score=73.78 Tamp_06389:1270-2562(-)